MDTPAANKLSAADWPELERRIRMAGGRLLPDRCEAVQLEAVKEGKKEAPKGETCGCGALRRVLIPYAPPTVDPAEKVGEYVACANCDSVALQPMFAGVRSEDA